MAKPEERPPTTKGALKKRWSTLSLLKSVGLSKTFMGEEAYNAFIEKANEGVSGEWIFLFDAIVSILSQMKSWFLFALSHYRRG